MKTPLAFVLALSPCAIALAASQPPPVFTVPAIALPPLSFSEASQRSQADFRTIVIALSRSVDAAPKKRISNMPVLTPRADLDAQLLIKTPDDTVDYKLTIQPPAVESAK